MFPDISLLILTLVEWVDDGCPTLGNKVVGVYKETSFKTCVRCCSNDGKTCSTPYKCYRKENWMTYNDATSKCKESGMRLCTRYELKDGVCCRNGGGGDSFPVWTSSPWTSVGI